MKQKKTIILLVAVALVIGIAAGSTLAWLTDTTGKIENTFTTSDIDVELTESEDLDLKMIPGYTITKDPKVTVEAGSEKCYLFVKLQESSDYDTYMTYTVAEGWTKLENETGVYYRVVDSTEQDQEFYVIKNDQVTVKTTVTKEQMQAADSSKPTLTVTAYASQYMKNNTEYFEVADAWVNVNQSNT